MNICKSCYYFEPVTERSFMSPEEAAGGVCRCPKLTENYEIYEDDSLVYSYDEGGWFWVGPNFGCIHWRED